MIYFVRHGESEANLKNVFSGQKDDSVLTEKGREQARLTAEEIKREGLKIDKIISSPLLRTFETAEIIAKELNFDTSKILTDRRIIEYDMGSLTGKHYHKVTSALMITAENAENPDLFHQRVLSCVQELSKLSENILLVSHAGVGRLLEVIRENKDIKSFYDLPRYANASVTKIDWIK